MFHLIRFSTGSFAGSGRAMQDPDEIRSNLEQAEKLVDFYHEEYKSGSIRNANFIETMGEFISSVSCHHITDIYHHESLFYEGFWCVSLTLTLSDWSEQRSSSAGNFRRLR